ncbi:hypothetical protein JOC95_001923 [Bacillus tianshenii]|uniref:PLD phosphodiesterase domain-containing protein n=1 Tax=Sutcliffiella tianshenii TaxID=1463404 RepID=A0ABS2NZF2_9BACI|nr:hypothetical protein [Bacillus tianshenii]MBM7620071.1 hypothetical protein [Bacillus tianshenii]
MTQTNINPITLTEEVSYIDQTVHHIWEKKKTTTEFQSNNQDLLEKITYTSQVICIMSAEELPVELLQALQSATRRGVRVYLLCDQLYPIYKDTIVGKALIRSGNAISGNIFLFDPGVSGRDSGFVASASALTTDDPLKVFIQLSSVQLKEAYQYFIWNFWKSADHEYMTSEQIDNPTKIMEPPFDVYPLVENTSLVYGRDTHPSIGEVVQGYIEGATHEITLLLSGVNDFPEWLPILIEKMRFGLKVSLYIKLERKNHPFVQSLAEHGAFIFGYDVVGNDIVLVDREQGILLNSPIYKGEIYNNKFQGLRLSNHDVEMIFSVLQSYQKMSHWEYFSEKKLGEIESPLVLLGTSVDYSEDKVLDVKDYSEVNLGEWTAPSLRDLKDQNVRPDLKSEGYIKSAKYTWTVIPKIRSSKAQIDSLYSNWESERNSFVKHLAELKSLAKYSEEKQKSLTGLSSFKLTRFFLGKNQKVKNLIMEIDRLTEELEKTDLLTLEAWKRSVDKANTWVEELTVTKDEIDLRIEENEQEMKWNDKKANLEKQIEEIEKSLTKLEVEKSNISSDNTDSFIEREQELIQAEARNKELISVLEEFEIENQVQLKSLRTKNKVLKLFSILDDGIKELTGTKKNKIDRVYNVIISKLEKALKEEFNATQTLQDILNSTKIKEKKDLLTYIKIQLVKNPLFTYDKKIDKSVEEKYLEQSTTIEESELVINKLTLELNLIHHSITDKLKKQDKKIEELIRDKKKVQEEIVKLGSTFKYQPPSSGNKGDESLKSVLGNKKKKSKTTEKEAIVTLKAYHSKAPNEILPSVGTLYLASGQRQLAIRNWGELEKGESEALRLNAELVAERV